MGYLGITEWFDIVEEREKVRYKKLNNWWEKIKSEIYFKKIIEYYKSSIRDNEVYIVVIVRIFSWLFLLATNMNSKKIILLVLLW